MATDLFRRAMGTRLIIPATVLLAFIFAGVVVLRRKEPARPAPVVEAPAPMPPAAPSAPPELVAEWQRFITAAPFCGLTQLQPERISMFESRLKFLMLHSGDHEAVFKEGKLVKTFHHRLGYYSLFHGGQPFRDWNETTITVWDRQQAVTATRGCWIGWE